MVLWLSHSVTVLRSSILSSRSVILENMLRKAVLMRTISLDSFLGRKIATAPNTFDNGARYVSSFDVVTYSVSKERKTVEERKWC